MPKGPNGQRRPADAIGCAIMVGKIAIGELDESSQPKKKIGVNGGLARSDRMTSQKRSEIASVAATARWAVRKGVL